MKKRSIFLFLCLSGLLISVVQADTLTPDSYILADLEARRITIEGMERRLTLLQNGADSDQQMQSADWTNREVETAFARYGTTGASHAAYGTQHSERIAESLVDHPEWQQESLLLNERFEALSEQMDAIIGGNQ